MIVTVFKDIMKNNNLNYAIVAIFNAKLVAITVKIV